MSPKLFILILEVMGDTTELEPGERVNSWGLRQARLGEIQEDALMARNPPPERNPLSGNTALSPTLSKLRQENPCECEVSLSSTVSSRSKQDPVKEGGKREEEGRVERGERLKRGREGTGKERITGNKEGGGWSLVK